MKRIIRLTESDLTRIVRRVLNEGLLNEAVKQIGNSVTYNGKTYYAQLFGDNKTIAYVDPSKGTDQGIVLGNQAYNANWDKLGRPLVKALNTLTGFNIPEGTGYTVVDLVKGTVGNSALQAAYNDR